MVIFHRFLYVYQRDNPIKRGKPQELNNGRFAMFATSGILAAELYTGQVRMIWWEPPRNSREIWKFRSKKRWGSALNLSFFIDCLGK
jgi:hypothetical protein